MNQSIDLCVERSSVIRHGRGCHSHGDQTGTKLACHEDIDQPSDCHDQPGSADPDYIRFFNF